jgi:UDP-3-O-acyl-N-acetylglucosamine deacetylase
MFQKADKSFFQSTLQRAGITKQVQASRYLVLVEAVMKERFGEGALIHVEPKYIKNRSLAIAVAHPAVGEEIRRQEEALISEINRRIGHPEIVRMHFILPSAPEEAPE